MRRKATEMASKLPKTSDTRQRLIEITASTEGQSIDSGEWKDLIRSAWIEIGEAKRAQASAAEEESLDRASEDMREHAAWLASTLPETSDTRRRLIEVAASPERLVDDEDWRHLVQDGWIEMEAAGGLDWVPDVPQDDPGPARD
jgi:hypothetical protein